MMFGLFGSKQRNHPPLVVPESAIRPGEDDRALVRAVSDYVDLMRREGGWLASELLPEAMAVAAADRYLSIVERRGHRAYLAETAHDVSLERAAAGLAASGADEVTALHKRLVAWRKKRKGGDDLPEALDEAFRTAGGRGAVDPGLAAAIATSDGLEVKTADEYPARVVALCAAHPEAKSRKREAKIAEIEAALTGPVEAGVAIIVARVIGRQVAVTVEPTGETEGAAEVLTARGPRRDYRVLRTDDLIAVQGYDPVDERLKPVGHLALDRIEIAIDWARRGHIALAAVKAVEAIGGKPERIEAVVFESRKRLKKSGAEAAAFHLSLSNAPRLSLVVFPKLTALVDPNSNRRLAEFEHKALATEAAALERRLAERNA